MHLINTVSGSPYCVALGIVLKLLICLLYKCQNLTVTCDGAAHASFLSLHVLIFICTFLKYWGTKKAICSVSVFTLHSPLG